LKSFAMETLPIALDHLRMAQTIAAQVTGQTPPTLAGSGSAAPKR